MSTDINSKANSEKSGAVFQVTFSDQSIAELNKLAQLEQMKVMEKLGNLTAKDLESPRGDLGRFHRNNKTFYRLRVGDFRMYFDVKEDTLFCHYLLQQRTWTDFAFRFKLPVSEESMVEQHQSFWQYLESLGKSK